MKKFSKIGKRVFALFLVALMNINTYATTTSNDGSGFITKAEFDTLINDFNNEMDKYQSGLNAKIDTAIAEYIAGVSGTRSDKLDNLDVQVKQYGVNYTTFWNYPTTAFKASNKNNYGSASWYAYYAKGQNGNGWLHLFRKSSKAYDTAGYDPVEYGSANSIYMLRDFTGISDTGAGYDDGLACLYVPKPYVNKILTETSYSVHSIAAATNWTTDAIDNRDTKNHTVNINNKDKESGTYNNTETCNIGCYSVNMDTKISETWTEDSSIPFNGAGYPSANLISSQTLYCVNYNRRTVYDGDQVTITNAYGSRAGRKYLQYSIGDRTYWALEGATSDTWTYKYYNHKIYTINAVNLSNYAASSVVSSPVRLYNGVPLTKVYNLGKVKFDCTISNSDGNDTYLTVSDEPFDNDDRYSTKTYTVSGKTYDHILLNQKLTHGKKTSIEFDVTYLTDDDKRDGRTLYYRLSQETSSDNNIYMIMNVNSDIMIDKNN